MNRDTPIKKYCKKVNQYFDCSRKEKAKLLHGLYEEITSAEPQAMDYPALVREYGAPEEMAVTLQTALKEENLQQYQRKRRQGIKLFLSFGVFVIVLLSATLAFFVDYMREDTPAKLVEVIYDELPDLSVADALVWENEE